jgi:hypothetical protein
MTNLIRLGRSQVLSRYLGMIGNDKSAMSPLKYRIVPKRGVTAADPIRSRTSLFKSSGRRPPRYCHAALNSRNRACLFSIFFRDFTALSLHSIAGPLHINLDKVSAKVSTGYKYKDDTILFACIGFCPGFEYKQLGKFRELSAVFRPESAFSSI